MYHYAITQLIDAHDADTCRVVVDLGFRVTLQVYVRLAGINAPELSTPEGKIARDFAREWFAAQKTLAIKTEKPKQEKYGRWLGIIEGDNGEVLNDVLVREGMAVPYMVERA